jgi:hypothetical protein
MIRSFLSSRVEWLVGHSGAAMMAFGLLALKPPSLSPQARRMLIVCAFELVAISAILAIAPWLGVYPLNLALIAVYSIAFGAALAFVLVRALAKNAHL